MVLIVRTIHQAAIFGLERSTSPTPKKVRLQKSTSKTMLINFFAADSINHKGFITEGTTVIGRCYLEVLKRFIAQVHRVRPRYREKGNCSFLYDNAPAYTSIIVRKFMVSKLSSCWKNLLTPQVYSPVNISVSQVKIVPKDAHL